ncbi:hypothetical protein ACFLZU_02005 [Thermodesulfobacteriota bacterium]
MSFDYELDEVIGAVVRYSILDSDAFFCEKENIEAGYFFNVSDYLENVLGVYNVRLNRVDSVDSFVDIDFWLKDGLLRLLLGDGLSDFRLRFCHKIDTDILCSGKELMYVFLRFDDEECKKIVNSENFKDFMCVFDEPIYVNTKYREQKDEDLKEFRRLLKLYYDARTRLTDDKFNKIITHFKNGGDLNFDFSKFNL